VWSFLLPQIRIPTVSAWASHLRELGPQVICQPPGDTAPPALGFLAFRDGVSMDQYRSISWVFTVRSALVRPARGLGMANHPSSSARRMQVNVTKATRPAVTVTKSTP
jgi:hypothetical protein